MIITLFVKLGELLFCFGPGIYKIIFVVFLNIAWHNMG